MKTRRPRAVAALLTYVPVALALLAACATNRPRVTPDPIDREFRRIASEVVQAVREKNLDTLVRYSRPDFSDTLRQPGSGEYCFVFDSSCGQGGPSVYEVITSAQQLVVRVDVASAAPDDPRDMIDRSGRRPRQAGLMLFDGARVDERQINDKAYLCPRWGTEIMTWAFEYRLDVGWRALTPAFDYATDYICCCP